MIAAARVCTLACRLVVLDGINTRISTVSTVVALQNKYSRGVLPWEDQSPNSKQVAALFFADDSQNANDPPVQGMPKKRKG
jgi:hypothetical protein